MSQEHSRGIAPSVITGVFGVMAAVAAAIIGGVFLLTSVRLKEQVEATATAVAQITPSPLPTYTIAPTYTPFPTYTPALSADPLVSQPTPMVIIVTATPTPSPTPLLNTLPGTRLKVGDTWKQDGFHLTLTDVDLRPDPYTKGVAYLRFEVTNHTGQDLLVALDYRSITLETNTGTRLSTSCYSPDFYTWRETIPSESSKTVSFCNQQQAYYEGDFYAPDVSYILVTVRDWSRISEAIWQVDIQH